MGNHYGLDIPTLRELRIDVDKEWLDPDGQPRGITKLKEVAPAMSQGAIAYRGLDTLEKLAAEYGIGYNFLHAQNTGIDQPDWMNIQELVAYITGGKNRMIAPPTLVIPSPSISVEATAASAPPGKTATPSLAIPAPSIEEATATASPLAVDGGIAHDDDPPTDTDETTETNDATANDMHLLPSPAAVGDGFYFGLANPFDWLCLNIGTPGVGVWTITWKYWNGTTWTALTLIGAKDQTDNFRAATGKHWVQFERPSDWSETTILSKNLYWIKGEVTSYTSMTTQPLGTQAWIGRYT